MPLLQVDRADSEGSEPEMSVDSDSSDDEDDDVEDSPRAREQALEEAKALLRDKGAKQGKHGPQYFEDEARLFSALACIRTSPSLHNPPKTACLWLSVTDQSPLSDQ